MPYKNKELQRQAQAKSAVRRYKERGDELKTYRVNYTKAKRMKEKMSLRCINCGTEIETRLYCGVCIKDYGTPQPQPAVKLEQDCHYRETVQDIPEPQKRRAFKVGPTSYPLAMKFKRTEYGYSGALFGNVEDRHSIYRRRK